MFILLQSDISNTVLLNFGVASIADTPPYSTSWAEIIFPQAFGTCVSFQALANSSANFGGSELAIEARGTISVKLHRGSTGSAVIGATSLGWSAIGY